VGAGAAAVLSVLTLLPSRVLIGPKPTDLDAWLDDGPSTSGPFMLLSAKLAALVVNRRRLDAMSYLFYLQAAAVTVSIILVLIYVRQP
jgi:hypothetical protein